MLEEWVPPYTRRCGIPQGDPLSMMFVAMITRPWILIMREREVSPSLLVDDILIMTTGDSMAQTFEKALDITHRYLIDMGGMVSPDKSHNFSTDPTIRAWLRNKTWEEMVRKSKSN